MTEVRKYGGDAVQAIRTASLAQYHLSAMADRKASMMMGASFVVFTICVAQATTRGNLPLALMVLGVSAFLAAMISAIAVMPTIHAAKDLQGERNLMFFGGFADMKEDEYVREMMDRLADQEQFLAMVARDVYQNGQVLAHKKYRLLKYAYSIFILGLVASVVAFLATGIGGGRMSEVEPTEVQPRVPKLGDPDYEFPKEVHNLLMAANSTNITLSGMADSKASILLGASFVVFSLSIGSISEGKASTPLLVLTLFSLIATIFGVLTVRPNKMLKARTPVPGNKVNILFFGSYIDCPREEFVDEMMRVLSSEEETYRRLTRDLWDHGHVLRDTKFKWLYWSYTFFFWGMIVTAATVVGQLVYNFMR